ncbi:hypothetical protein QAD02_015018 [Eretmocerus hayati]|uniref:Uncharacterized protein n=1 Tax=Eretmocerus hayati TaxID=131215 RepID=A0ACC2P8C4_9HYME|nr:hypothetical protein QAD02_015018 [Eretmocerus hayati]
MRIRRWWTKPHLMPEYRDRYGAYNILFTYFSLRDHEEFYLFTGMSVSQFSYILDHVRDDLTPMSNRPGLSPELKLAAVLNFLRHGDKVATQSWFFLIGRSTMYKLIATVPRILHERLSPIYFKMPQGNEWLEIAEDYYKLYGYPHCCGALDGRHFEVKRPPNSGSLYFDRKQFNSIVLMAMCDAHRRFTYASVGNRGRHNDAGIFAHCSLARGLINGEIELPPARALPGSNVVFPFTIIADGGFAQTRHVMTPYKDSKRKSIEEMIFDIRLTEARKIVECAFGTLCVKFQIFASKMNFSPKTCQGIILCCMTLHNFLITSRLNAGNQADEGNNMSQDASSSSQEILEEQENRRRYSPDVELQERDLEQEEPDGESLRDILKIYFVTDGDVAWQWKKLD